MTPQICRAARMVYVAGAVLAQAVAAQGSPGRLSQEGAPRMASFGVAEGLSQSSVYALTRDARGFLWAGTHDGLNRFDGYAFEPYRHAPDDPHTLSHDRIVALHPEADGSLWVLSLTGLDRLDAQTGRFVRHVLREPAPTEAFGAFAPGRDGHYWIGTNYGLYRFDPQRGLFSRIRGSANVRAVVEDAGGTVWVATEAGLRVLDDGALVRPAALPAGLTGGDVRAVRMDRQQRLWAGAESALFVREEPDAPFRPVTVPHAVHVLAEAPDGRLWVGGPGRGARPGGLSVVDPATGRLGRVPLEGMAAHVQALWIDPAGTVWVGADGAGVLRFDVRPPRFARADVGPGGEQEAFVRAVVADADGAVWVGTTEGLRYRDGAGRWRVFRQGQSGGYGLPHNDVRALLRSRDSTLWVGTVEGLVRWDGRARFHHERLPLDYPLAQFVTRLLETRDGALWVATRTGVFRQARGGAFTVLEVVQGSVRGPLTLDVRALAEDTQGRIWIGDYTGSLYRYDPDDPRGAVDLTTVIALGSTITSLAVDRRGRLWTGTHRGLVRLDPETGAQRRFDERDGLLNAFIYFLLADETGWFWAGTNRGLIRFDPHAETPAFRAYTPADGLQSNEFNSNAAFRAPDGTLYAGGIAGLNTFSLASVQDDPVPPPVAFTGFKRFDEAARLPVDLNAVETLRLDWRRDAVFSFEFAGLDLLDPERVRYRYRMEGVDPEWVEAGTRREARYTNLAPGTYTFHVTAANADGVWNPEGRTLRVVIPPPWWRTGWFAVFAGLVLLGVVGGGVRVVSVRALQRRLRALEAARALERAVHEERARISADVHDHVGASLTQIQLLSEVARRARNGRRTDSLDRIAEAARSATQDLDAIVWAINPAHDRLDAFADYLCAYAGDYCEAVGLRCRFARPPFWPEGQLPAEIRHPVFVVVREALANAARHAQATTVHLRFLSEGEDRVAVEVEDDGIGFDPAGVDRWSNGLTTMRARTEKAGGGFEVTSAPGAGTRVRIVLPLQTPADGEG